MPILTERTWSRRVFLTTAGQAAAILAAGQLSIAEASTVRLADPTAETPLQSFIATYLRAMYAPGLTLGLVHSDGSTSADSFGLSNVAEKQHVQPGMLFQIGSISKSFCALVLLQIRDEGKLDLQKPILEYLPWLSIEMPYGAITVHHLLTHSSGLPDDTPLFLSDRNARIVQGFPPGSQFHYSNLGFEILGHLAASLDAKTYAAVLQARILDPLEMKYTEPAISPAILPQEATSYIILRDDLSAGRNAPLQVAPREVFATAAGCIASTPADMARYMKMLLAHGAGPHGRIVSEESFNLFATPHVEAEEFGKGSHYGYGIAVDTLDGHKILKHTGGMNSFASSMQVDLDANVAAFASINAMQGYRPNPVTKYALQVMRAKAEGKPPPPPDALDDPSTIDDAHDYAATYTGDAGAVQIITENQSLFAVMGTTRIRLLRAAGDTFVADDPAWQTYPWEFTRDQSSEKDSQKESKPKAKPPVTELVFGSKWYVNPAYKGPKSFPVPRRFTAFEGTYDSGTDGISVKILKGALVVGGAPVTEVGDGLFRFADEPHSPETVELSHIVDGRARLLVLSGRSYWRFESA